MKIPLGKMPCVYPIPIALLGAQVGGKPNYATVGEWMKLTWSKTMVKSKLPI